MKLNLIIQDWKDIKTGESYLIKSDKVEPSPEFKSINIGNILDCEIEFKDKEIEQQLREMNNKGLTLMLSIFISDK